MSKDMKKVDKLKKNVSSYIDGILERTLLSEEMAKIEEETNSAINNVFKSKLSIERVLKNVTSIKKLVVENEAVVEKVGDLFDAAKNTKLELERNEYGLSCKEESARSDSNSR